MLVLFQSNIFCTSARQKRRRYIHISIENRGRFARHATWGNTDTWKHTFDPEILVHASKLVGKHWKQLANGNKTSSGPQAYCYSSSSDKSIRNCSTIFFTIWASQQKNNWSGTTIHSSTNQKTRAHVASSASLEHIQHSHQTIST